MTISATMILDSVSPNRVRLTTLQLRYPKFIHGELMTHRVFSRNASSSRAIPVAKLIENVRTDPVEPLKWLAKRPGMQGGDEIIGAEREALVHQWNLARTHAIDAACELDKRKAHKQHINRVLEPFAHINVLITSTHYANFLALRDHPAAQPEIQELAVQMRRALDASTPGLLKFGQWHLPYVTPDDWTAVNDGSDSWGAEHVKTLIKISVARCARVSYLTQDGKVPHIARDLELFDRLVGSTPLHASPAEHQCSPDEQDSDGFWKYPHWHGNLSGWIQFRKTLPNEAALDSPYSLEASTVNSDLPSEPEETTNEQSEG